MKTDQSQKHSISLFLSSTFQDMQNERDKLLKHTFMILKNKCANRGVLWTEVDLRWGITEEEANSGKVLPLCFFAIDNSRPYFMCMIGGRYGSTISQKEKPRSLIRKQKWLNEVWDKCSITELEIMYAVFKKPEIAMNSYFFFKNIPANDNGTETSILKPQIQDPAIEKLKKKIKTESDRNKATIKVFPYTTVDDLDTIVIKEFSKLIDAQFPEKSQIDSIDIETQCQNSLIETHKVLYYPRGKRRYEQRIVDWIDRGNTPLVITGESGSGKTSLLANFVSSYSPDDKYVIHYFVGYTAKSTNCSYMLNYLISKLKKDLNLSGEIPNSFSALKTDFIRWLEKAGNIKPIVLVLDALNQLDDEEGVHNLSWLPKVLPPNVSLILSTLPGKIYSLVKSYGWKELTVSRLSNWEKEKIIRTYFTNYHKTLDENYCTKIVSAVETENPLYLCSLLEELRLFGDFNGLSNKVDEYLSCSSTEELFKQILHRWETDYAVPNRPNVIPDIFKLIWASRKGLSINELSELLKNHKGPLPHIYVVQLLYSSQKALMYRGDYINFSHEYIRKAVESVYLPNFQSKSRIHFRLAQYFKDAAQTSLKKNTSIINQNKRFLEEYPWQLCQSEKWNELVESLKSPKFFTNLWNHNSYDLRNYWNSIEKNSGYSPTIVYHDIINNLDSLDSSPINIQYKFALSRFFELRDNDNAALQIYCQLLIIYKKLDDIRGYASMLGKIGWVLYREGKKDKALEYYLKQENIARKYPGEAFLNILQISLNYQALLYQEDEAMYEKALSLLDEKERICQKLGQTASLQISISNKGLFLFKQGRYDEAIECFKEQENICLNHGFIEGLQISYGRQAMYYEKMQDYEKALLYQEKKEETCRNLSISFSLATSLASKGNILLAMKRPMEAKNSFSEGLIIAQNTNNKDAETKCELGLLKVSELL